MRQEKFNIHNITVNHHIKYKRAGIEEIEILTQMRIQVLRAANKIDDATDMSVVEKESYDYYEKALTNGSHIY